MSRNEIPSFKTLPILGILRGIDESSLVPLADAMIAAGLTTVEVAMNTENACALIARLKEYAKDRLCVGAGTVLSGEQYKKARQAHAAFIVSPAVVDEVIESCVRDAVPVFPGALTPQEIYRAWRQGATMVKVFPASVFGPQYFKEIKGPFNDIQLLACGGVKNDTLGPFFKNGASAVAFGGSVFKKEWIHAKHFGRIRDAISSLIAAYKSLKQ